MAGFSVRLNARFSRLRSIGLIDSFTIIKQRLRGHVSPFFNKNTNLFSGKGIEIGGPSGIFRDKGYLPVYSKARELDNVNFSDETKWEGSIKCGRSFVFNQKLNAGAQFVHEASDLSSLKDASYDFLISSHMLEHSANPIKVLHEWKRVIDGGGILLMVLPHKDGTFDHRRPVTNMSHMIEDYHSNVSEVDSTHLREILQLHDLKRDPSQQSANAFRAWIEANPQNRGAHHHVFNSLLAVKLMNHVGLQILCVEPVILFDICLFVRKPQGDSPMDNSAFLSSTAPYLRNSPFKSDHLLAFETSSN